MTLKLRTEYYDLNPRNSYITFASSYNYNKIWRANLSTKYLRARNTIESEKVDLYRSLSSRSELFSNVAISFRNLREAALVGHTAQTV